MPKEGQATEVDTREPFLLVNMYLIVSSKSQNCPVERRSLPLRGQCHLQFVLSWICANLFTAVCQQVLFLCDGDILIRCKCPPENQKSNLTKSKKKKGRRITLQLRNRNLQLIPNTKSAFQDMHIC